MSRGRDKVSPQRSETVYEIFHVHQGGDQIDLHVPGTNLLRLRTSTDTLSFVERKPGPTRTADKPAPTLDVGVVRERIRSVEADNLNWLEDDIACSLWSYLAQILCNYLSYEAMERQL